MTPISSGHLTPDLWQRRFNAYTNVPIAPRHASMQKNLGWPRKIGRLSERRSEPKREVVQTTKKTSQSACAAPNDKSTSAKDGFRNVSRGVDANCSAVHAHKTSLIYTIQAALLGTNCCAHTQRDRRTPLPHFRSRPAETTSSARLRAVAPEESGPVPQLYRSREYQNLPRLD